MVKSLKAEKSTVPSLDVTVLGDTKIKKSPKNTQKTLVKCYKNGNIITMSKNELLSDQKILQKIKEIAIRRQALKKEQQKLRTQSCRLYKLYNDLKQLELLSCEKDKK